MNKTFMTPLRLLSDECDCNRIDADPCQKQSKGWINDGICRLFVVENYSIALKSRIPIHFQVENWKFIVVLEAASKAPVVVMLG